MLYFQDNIYSFNGIKEERKIVRCVLLDEDEKVVLELMERNDIFSYSKYVETPGGGLNDEESLQDGLKREIKEELGYDIEIISELEIVEDYYNLIYRKNINHYFLAKIVAKGDKHLEELEKEMIRGEIHLSFDEAINKIKENIGGVGKLVLQRELPILEMAKQKYMELKK